MLTAKILVTSLGIAASLAASASAQEGYVGVYTDPEGTQACASVPAYTSATLYVVATTAGASESGITGAEFRIEVTNPTGWLFSYTGPAAANLVLGNPLDTTVGNDNSGVNISYAACVQPSAGKIALGTIAVFNVSGSSTTLLVKRHNRPSNAGFSCPLFVECGSSYPMSCMSASAEDVCEVTPSKGITSENDPIVFISTLNPDSTEAGRLRYPEREVIVQFVNGVIQLPSNQAIATLQATTINSQAVQTTLEQHAVESIEKAFPSFDLADTVAVARTGELVPQANLAELYILLVPTGGSAPELAGDLNVDSVSVVYAEPNAFNPEPHAICTYTEPPYLCPQTVECPNDPRFMEQWYLFNAEFDYFCDEQTDPHDIEALGAWEVTTGSPTTMIAILDNGIYSTHEDINGKFAGGDAGLGMWGSGSISHGTAVAGIAAAWGGNGVGITGIDWNARLLSGIVTDDNGQDATYRTIMNSVYLGADILNYSWGHRDEHGNYTRPVTIQRAIANSYKRNLVSVASMGNRGDLDNAIQYPAACDQQVIAVGATAISGAKSTESSTGFHIDVAAPGVSMLTTMPYPHGEDRYAAFGGTSAAAPVVSGIAGLLLSKNPHYANDDIERIIEISATGTFWNQNTGYGSARAGAAMELVSPPNELIHASGVGGHIAASVLVHEMYWIDVPWPGSRSGMRHEVRTWASFPTTFNAVPRVWGRSVGTKGWSSDGFQFGNGWCEAVPGTITTSGCWLRTYVYQVNGNYLPCHPTDVIWAYTILGVPSQDPTDVTQRERQASRSLVLRSSNPWRGTKNFQFITPAADDVKLEVIDVAGRVVRRVFHGPATEGSNYVSWDTRDEQGQHLASGVYIARLQAGSQSASAKVVILR